MGVSWQEAMSTPIDVIYKDIEYISIENQLKGNELNAKPE